MSDCCSAPGLTPFSDALTSLLSKVNTTQRTEAVSLEDALGCVLSESIESNLSIPSADNSAMDGYALRAGDATVNVKLKQIAKVFAGHPYSGEVQAGQCVRIMTGGQVPSGCDAVVMQENTHAHGDEIEILQSPSVGENIRRAGEDIQQGQIILQKGKRLSAADIGLLASLGINQIPVFAPLKVALISTGDELQIPGRELKEGQFYESNGYTVSAVLKRLGVTLINLGIVKDDLDELTQAFTKADELADVVITSGGVSVGEADYTKTVLEKLGKIDFWKLAIKPGKPFAFGFLPNSYFIGLPGNPVSAMVTLHQLAVPMLRKISGEPYRKNLRIQAVTTAAIKKRPGRMDFQRGVYEMTEQGISVVPTGAQGSGILTSVSRANCYIVLAQESGSVDAGDNVMIEPFDGLLL